jgi:hypothetical protein
MLAVYVKVFACPPTEDIPKSLESWILDWKITIDVSMLFVKLVTRIQQPQPVHFTEESVQCVDRFPCVGTVLERQQI